MSRLRVAAFVAGGPVALRALEALAAKHEVAVIVRAGPSRHAWRHRVALAVRAVGLVRDPVRSWARSAAVPILTTVGGDDARVAARIRSLAPDIGCIATYPRRISDVVLGASGRVCLNVHMSLLPRHRGANPLFWTYHAGDLEAGVTVHAATSRLDAGPILRRQSFPIARGESVVDVHARGAALGAQLLADAVADWANGNGAPQEQDESAATPAPSPIPGRRYADMGGWSAAQAWHFLAGLLARYSEPLVDTRGKPVRYARVPGFETRDVAGPPGSVVRAGAGWMAWASDGVVHLAAGSRVAA